MGPANRKLALGRGDKNQAAAVVLNHIVFKELDELTQKYYKLDSDEQTELSSILAGEDVEGILFDKAKAAFLISGYNNQ